MRENKDKVSVIHFEWVTCAVKEKNLPLFGAAGHAANGPACIGISRDAPCLLNAVEIRLQGKEYYDPV